MKNESHKIVSVYIYKYFNCLLAIISQYTLGKECVRLSLIVNVKAYSNLICIGATYTYTQPNIYN